MGLFRRREATPGPSAPAAAVEPAEPAEPSNPYPGLRARFLALTEDTEADFLRGAAFEVGTGGACASVVCVADGTTSLYLSTGGGQIGLGGHEPVRRANEAFRAAVLEHLGQLAPVAEVPMVAQGDIHVVAVTADGLRMVRAREDDAEIEGSEAWPLYLAGQQLVTQIRLLDEVNRGRRTF